MRFAMTGAVFPGSQKQTNASWPGSVLEVIVDFAAGLTDRARHQRELVHSSLFLRCEGCGNVALKCLADAEADADRTRAVIRGRELNRDDASPGLTFPSGPAQAGSWRPCDAVPNSGPPTSNT